MHSAVILLGTNLGEREENLLSALKFISLHAGKIIKQSQVYKTEAWGNEDQPYYLNQVIEIVTGQTPSNLLKLLLSIESDAGRHRRTKWEERIIDLDILYYDDKIIDEPGLTIPHPYLHLRRFTLEPLKEILPGKIHPLLKQSTLSMLASLNDNLSVYPLREKTSFTS